MEKNVQDKSGFTLLELLLVISILVIIAGINSDFYGSFMSGAQLDDNAKIIVYDLKNTRDKAMNGQDDRDWGARFAKGINDFYEIFSTPSGSDYNNPVNRTVIVTSYLKNNIRFELPGAEVESYVLFSKISGQTASTSVTIKNSTVRKIISIKEQGLID